MLKKWEKFDLLFVINVLHTIFSDIIFRDLFTLLKGRYCFHENFRHMFFDECLTLYNSKKSFLETWLLASVYIIEISQAIGLQDPVR